MIGEDRAEPPGQNEADSVPIGTQRGAGEAAGAPVSGDEAMGAQENEERAVDAEPGATPVGAGPGIDPDQVNVAETVTGDKRLDNDDDPILSDLTRL